jgi:hypothetical protein
MKQLGLFIGGSSFLLIAQIITRRSIVRRYKATFPSFFQPSSHRTGEGINGAMEAFEALNIATLHVMAAGIMTTGVLAYGFDIASVSEIRPRVRQLVGFGESDEAAEKQAEEELERWIASILDKRRGGEKDGKDDGKR